MQGRHLSRLPQASIALRYNRRGVGQSTGRIALWADSDCRDLRAVCGHLAAMQRKSSQGLSASTASPKAEVRLWVIGYSWGAVLAAHASCFVEVHGVICISPPAGGVLLLRTLMYLSSACKRADMAAAWRACSVVVAVSNLELCLSFASPKLPF